MAPSSGQSSERSPHPGHPPRSTRGRAGSAPERPALPPPRDLLRLLCQAVVRLLRKQCPEAFPKAESEPVAAGEPGPEVPLEGRSVNELVRAAAETAGGGETVLWDDGDSQLLVLVSELRTTVAEGLILVRIPVECDETGRAQVQVAFAVGSENRPAGLLAATEARPLGPAEVVDTWGEALTALAWQAITKMAAGIAQESGRDPDGAGLLPLGLVARRSQLRLATLARHPFDRERP